MGQFLDRWLPPPIAPNRTRPDDLLYSVDQKPPNAVCVGMGVQHAALALIFTVYIVIAARAIGLDEGATAAFVSAGIFLMGVATLLQALPGRFGAGIILVAVPSPGRLPSFVILTTQFGLASTMGATIVAGLATMAVARAIPRLRPVFPPEVIGVVLLMLGLTLVATGMPRSVGFTQGAFSTTALAASMATLATIIAVSLYTPRQLHALAMVCGVVVGTAVATVTGAVQPGGVAQLLAIPPVALPILGLHLPWPEFHLLPIALLLVPEVVGIMDVFGSVLAMDKMEDADWRRADIRRVARAVTMGGFIHVLHGLVGLLPNGTSAANVGLARATGVTAWRVGFAAGLVLMAVAFVPPLAGVIGLIPEPVIGGILLYTASFMIVAGIDLVTSRMMNTQRSFTVGLGVVCGAAVMLLPEFGREVPEWSRAVVSSGLTVGSIVAVGLNLLLRIGVKRRSEVTLDPAVEGKAAAEFLSGCGKAWGARQEVVARAGFAVSEALELLRQSGVAGAVRLAASFDEFNLRCDLVYRGHALQLDTGDAPDTETLMDQDGDALDAAMRRISNVLIQRLADTVWAGQRGADAELALHFQH